MRRAGAWRAANVKRSIAASRPTNRTSNFSSNPNGGDGEATVAAVVAAHGGHGHRCPGEPPLSSGSASEEG
jgi:hypothetical protein